MSTKFAIVFPGQGSQTVGMLADIYDHFDWVKELFAKASQVLGYDLWQVICEGPEERLNRTIYTQPAMLVADIVMWQVWLKERNMMPTVLAGHSLGEYAAFVAAESLDFSDAVALISKRAQYMQDAVSEGEGAMAAILALSDERVIAICEEVSSKGDTVVQPVNFNASGQIIIAGYAQAVDRVIELAKQKGAKAKKLPVSIPAHSDLMRSAANKLGVDLNQVAIKEPKIPVINNVDVAIYEQPNEIRNALVRQLFNPVHWVKIIEKIIEQGIVHIIECGPGKVLTGINKRINQDLQLYTLNSVNSLKQIVF